MNINIYTVLQDIDNLLNDAYFHSCDEETRKEAQVTNEQSFEKTNELICQIIDKMELLEEYTDKVCKLENLHYNLEHAVEKLENMKLSKKVIR